MALTKNERRIRIKNRIRKVVAGTAERPRLSVLRYIGVKKITRLKPRSAVVAFSVPEVYKIAELVRTQKGGAAIVMGALSPRTRNSQVQVYQEGEVDYLVATDAMIRRQSSCD